MAQSLTGDGTYVTKKLLKIERKLHFNSAKIRECIIAIIKCKTPILTSPVFPPSCPPNYIRKQHIHQYTVFFQNGEVILDSAQRCTPRMINVFCGNGFRLLSGICDYEGSYFDRFARRGGRPGSRKRKGTMRRICISLIRISPQAMIIVGGERTLRDSVL